ncbi:SusC/RagA family TonB-linked outer membrane protein [Cesiribacter andamanensis]|uniref:Outer membrane cobalamin receptor protein n=1 Tax=Cesiribacter andamanensis AMV16 TaxID=1279009 RepID=M7N7F4_9BACT|nr:TonB-dependent receptor [Cesiribacter andamanensis]EMR03166.1 Outer membrane cobalamin receptor protein [Cesiribacter andamanensis AMV16]
MKRNLYATFLLLLLTHWSWAQTGTLSGVVTDGQTAEALPGVNVRVKNTTRGAVTNFDGRYTLQVSPSDTLVFSYIGYLSEEVVVGNRNTLNMVMMPDIQTLSEVIVVGYGTQQKKDITGSVAVVGTEAFDSRPNTQVASLIQGRAAGVQVVSPSGKPGAGLNIRIRGTNSINTSSEPLYVVDGVPTNDTRSLNPADIESISILKDASSAAIYGAQGANGVVLITTKRGKEEKPRFEFSAYRGFSQVWNTLKVLNSEQYRDLMQELGYNTNWSQFEGNNTDWQQEVFQRGTSQNYQLSLTGKSNNTSYYVSGGWVQQEGAVRSAEMERYSFKLNLDQKVNDWFSLGTSINYSNYSDVDVTDNSAINQGGVILGVLSTPAVIGIYNPDGTFTSNPFQNWENPIASTDAAIRDYRNNRVLGNIYGEVSFLDGFKFRSNFGIDQNVADYDYFLDPFRTSYGRAMQGIGRYQTWSTDYYIWDNTLSYTKRWGEHNFNVLAGTVAQKFQWQESSMERRNFASDQVVTPGGGAELISANATKSEKTNASFIGRFNYDFADRYLFTANFRADGSSAFGPGKRWGYFPSFSAGWRISEEAFLQDAGVLTDLKLRAGWGVVGNDRIGNYPYQGRVGSGGNYPIGGVVMPGTYPASIENANLKWEESEQTNIGVDVAVLNNRLIFTADAYLRNTRDLLLNAPLPRSTGFDNAVQNIGQLQNKGLEFQLTSRNYTKDFTWTTDFNISFNRNKVVSIVGQEIYTANVAGRGEVSLVREGLPLGVFYGYVAGGVNPETGNMYYIDRNGESTETPTAADRVVIGNANPDFLYGLTNTFGYKGFGLNIFLQGSQGNDIFNATRIETEGMIDPKNQTIAVLDRWRRPGDETDIPRAGGGIANSRISTRFVEDGSYLRVKAATLSYDLPQSLVGRAKLGMVRLYATGENLLTFTKYSGFDPEVNAYGGSNLTQGVDFGTYPQTRNIIFGLNVAF